MAARVFHFKVKKEKSFLDTGRNFAVAQKNAVWPEDFSLVAEIPDAKSLDEAFKLTNSIDFPWGENHGVISHAEARSTSVGDVVELDGEAFRCENSGWSSLRNS